MKTIISFCFAAILWHSMSFAQSSSGYTYYYNYSGTPRVAVAPMPPGNLSPCETEAEVFGDASSEKKNDPGYEMYKKGYNFILDEEWDEAIKQLKAMLSKYPQSQFADDASYWIAYAYKSTGEDEKAKDLYKKFIKSYPKSNYYDDAVADLGEMNETFVISASGDSQHVVFSRGTGNAFSIGTGTTLKLAADQLRKSQRMMNQQLHDLRGTASFAVTAPPAFGSPGIASKVDRETQLKLDVLYALGDKKDDEKAFSALKEIAIDPKQNKTLRIAAMDELTDFKKNDPLPVFLEIAKRDTSEDFQNLAIDYIGSLSGNKNRSFEMLEQLFKVIPKYRISQLQAVLGSIAEIGTDKAVEFLGDVARKNDNYDLRHDAVYYLGSIGNDKARTELLHLLEEKK